ncbi:Poly(A)-specific ribonuclease PARN [Colletotrichum shisoi]|uniref:Poly(A)-specific ribonuclease PARN n=1 Tax=Colletotrichum shisoi TaxID=2078593 RepID=A0A5Q4C1Z7_9PEZI|nr:Poly(A)-specific ribonuclease PARN [Colletotrichum shisoi]
MEVTTENFWRQLPRILLSIANSQFVAIDLEMTGIADKNSEERLGNPTKQQIYEIARKIASTFNVFELGITCIISKPDGAYTTESFSFTVSPYLHADTRNDETFVKDVDRRLSVSYNTLKFLRKERIRMEKIYDDCVPYLSRKDVRKATERMEKRMKPWSTKEHPYDEDQEGLCFFSEYRPDDIKVLIPPSESKRRTDVYHQIVRSKAKVLVPHMRCRTWNYGATVIVYPVDDEEETDRHKFLQDQLTASLAKYSGIRLVIEALAGGDFAELIDADRIMLQSTLAARSGASSESEDQDAYSTSQTSDEWPSEPFLEPDNPWRPPDFVHDWPATAGTDQNIDSSNGWGDWGSRGQVSTSINGHEGDGCRALGEPNHREEVCTSDDDDDLTAQTLGERVADALKTIEDQLKRSRPVIVGHNQFMDLLFLYNTFVDDLPATLDDFLAKIHELFPYILDTKLMAIKHQAIEGEDPLIDLYDRFSDRKAMPHIDWPPGYGYGRSGTAHQAGFDSYMTATVFLRLACRLAYENLTGGGGGGDDDEEQVGQRLKLFYSREWLSAIGRNPDHFEGPRASSPGWPESSDTDDTGVNQPEWDDVAFDLVRNTIRIAPRRTVYLGQRGES